MGFLRIVSRPDFIRLPSLPLPFHVRSTGHYLIEGDFKKEWHVNEDFVELFWGISGEGEIVVSGEAFALRPGDVIWKLSTETHQYRHEKSGAPWELRWLTFDGPQADEFMKGYGYSRHLADAGPCPGELFQEVEAGLREMSPYSQRRMLAVLASVLALAGRRLGSQKRGDRLCDRFVALAQERYHERGINVDAIADILGVHRVTLAKCVKEAMDISPGVYLGRLRMQRALELLRDPDLSITEIAGRVGFGNVSHFARSLRKATGRGPRELHAKRGAAGHGA